MTLSQCITDIKEQCRIIDKNIPGAEITYRYSPNADFKGLEIDFSYKCLDMYIVIGKDMLVKEDSSCVERFKDEDFRDKIQKNLTDVKNTYYGHTSNTDFIMLKINHPSSTLVILEILKEVVNDISTKEV